MNKIALTLVAIPFLAGCTAREVAPVPAPPEPAVATAAPVPPAVVPMVLTRPAVPVKTASAKSPPVVPVEAQHALTVDEANARYHHDCAVLSQIEMEYGRSDFATNENTHLAYEAKVDDIEASILADQQAIREAEMRRNEANAQRLPAQSNPPLTGEQARAAQIGYYPTIITTR